MIEHVLRVYQAQQHTELHNKKSSYYGEVNAGIIKRVKRAIVTALVWEVLWEKESKILFYG